MVIEIMHKKFGEDRSCGFRVKWEWINRQTDILITIVRTILGSEVISHG